MTGPKFTAHDQHEVIRKNLWTQVYMKNIPADKVASPQTLKNAEKLANHAVSHFDKTFNSPLDVATPPPTT